VAIPPILETYENRKWWHRGVPYSASELFWDGVVHALGLVIAIVAGLALIAIAATDTAPEEAPAVAIYVVSLVVVLTVSLAFNLAPVNGVKRFLARLDQAAIFLLIAGTYTPVLALLGGTSLGDTTMIIVWGGALIGIALKLFVPEHFGRLALALYLGIGWSGVLVFQALATALPASTLWLLLAGGVTYSLGVIFHLWETLKFHNVVWHCFVVAGATLHLWAIFDCMVFTRV
jgi:hemolysin III